MITATCANSLRTLLTGLIDYAGLFPPAGLSMEQAVENFSKYLRGDFSWMLGRFICPAARLTELESMLTMPAKVPWRISALAGSDLTADVASIQAFNQRHAGSAVIDVTEFKAESLDAIREAGRWIPQGVTAYCEIPTSSDPQEFLSTIAANKLRAKIRTGGITAAAFPTSVQVARFLTRCAELPVTFKATAGLHHPVRGDYRLTYEADSDCAAMHGFLNLFLAAAFAHSGWNVEQLNPLLEETEAAAFQFTEAGAGWHGHALSVDQIGQARRQLAIAFGSCSFDEPIRDLKALGLL